MKLAPLRAPMFLRLVVVAAAIGAYAVVGKPSPEVVAMITAYFHTQMEGDCEGFVGLMSGAGFAISDPDGAPPTTNATALMANCVDEQAAFELIEFELGDVIDTGMGGAAVTFRCLSKFKSPPCQLDFTGIDTFEYTTSLAGDLGPRITAVRGYFDPSIPAMQSNCTPSHAHATLLPL